MEAVSSNRVDSGSSSHQQEGGVNVPNAEPGASYGWRARLGLLQPGNVSDNNPFEFYLMAPTGVQMILTSYGVPELSSAGYAAAIAGIEAPVRRLMARRADVLLQAGVPPTITAGWGSEDKLRDRIAAWTDLPFATDIGSCIAGLKVLGATRIAGLARENLQKGLAEYLEHAGLQIVAAAGIEAPEGEEMACVPLSLPYRAAVQLWRRSQGAEALLILGAFMPTVGMIQSLEAAIGAPVVASAQAMMWQGLRLAGVPAREVTAFGRLFQTG
jgi:maleate cis-trans isomerase